jgi:exonuclease SbcC
LKQSRLDRKATAAELSKAAAALLEQLQKRVAQASTKLTEAGSAKQTIEAEMAALHKEAGLEPGQTAAQALTHATEARGRIGATISKLEKDIERSKELTKKLKKVKAQVDVYDTLYADLANTKFIDFLLEDKRRLLSELASAQLRDMTGRYRFDDAGTFQVIDEFNADAERNVDSLSGGETFLASLALALGLAESVTRHGGRLQCFFLDEGFGSLDPDALQKALDGIERIATQDRVIGLVSHVQGVSERIVDKIELDRDDDGMTIVKEPPAPALRVVG